jgi:hypothetical protein
MKPVFRLDFVALSTRSLPMGQQLDCPMVLTGCRLELPSLPKSKGQTQEQVATKVFALWLSQWPNCPKHFYPDELSDLNIRSGEKS